MSEAAHMESAICGCPETRHSCQHVTWGSRGPPALSLLLSKRVCEMFGLAENSTAGLGSRRRRATPARCFPGHGREPHVTSLGYFHHVSVPSRTVLLCLISQGNTEGSVFKGMHSIKSLNTEAPHCAARAGGGFVGYGHPQNWTLQKEALHR